VILHNIGLSKVFSFFGSVKFMVPFRHLWNTLKLMTNFELLVPTSSTHLGGFGLPLLITIAIVLHVTKSQALIVMSVTEFWHALIYSCKCDYLLWALCILEKKVDEKWAHINHSQSHQWQMTNKLLFAPDVCTIEFMCQFYL